MMKFMKSNTSRNSLNSNVEVQGIYKLLDINIIYPSKIIL